MLYPRAFRREYASDMEQLFRDQLAEARQRPGRAPVIRLWARTIADLATSVPPLAMEATVTATTLTSKTACMVLALGLLAATADLALMRHSALAILPAAAFAAGILAARSQLRRLTAHSTGPSGWLLASGAGLFTVWTVAAAGVWPAFIGAIGASAYFYLLGATLTGAVLLPVIVGMLAGSLSGIDRLRRARPGATP